MTSLDLSISEQAKALFSSSFNLAVPLRTLFVPGRVNLIGEHIDYHDLPVLPMAIQKHIAIAFRLRENSSSRAVTFHHPDVRDLPLTPHPDPGPDGDWVNYLKGATAAVLRRWSISHGIDAAFASSLPSASGLSSSSALLVSFALALLLANGITPSLDELMNVLPEGERFVGTHGGAMDHAAVLAGRPHCALRVNFAPFAAEPVPIPRDWCFLVAHSLTHAQKSAALSSAYNAVRTAGTAALSKLGFRSFQEALENPPASVALEKCSEVEAQAFRHVNGEALRVKQATRALLTGDTSGFGQILTESHRSLRDQLGVSTPALDELVQAAVRAGAFGARLTGAGFGGCAIILTEASRCAQIRTRLMADYYSHFPDFKPEEHLFVAEPSAGALLELRNLHA